MVNCGLTPQNPRPRPRVCAVSYLNTIPLVWGFLQGKERHEVDLSFAVPSLCAERVAEGAADIGIIPVIEAARLGLDMVETVGIACRGPVRTILLVSRKSFEQIRTLAVDTGSRTSVQLARIVLKHRFNAAPELLPMPPDLPAMLEAADAALVIGDAALAIDPTDLDYPCLDLGAEWVDLTGLPMVFALWSGRREVLTPRIAGLFESSCRFGLAELDRIISEEAERRGFPEFLVHQYLTRHIVFQLDETDIRGMREYLRLAARLPNPVVVGAEAPAAAMAR